MGNKKADGQGKRGDAMRWALVDVDEVQNWSRTVQAELRASALLAVAREADQASGECSYPELAIALDALRAVWPDFDKQPPAGEEG